MSEQGRAATSLELARDRLVLDAAALEGALSTRVVSEHLDRVEADLRRSRLAGDLYAPDPGNLAGDLRYA